MVVFIATEKLDEEQKSERARIQQLHKAIHKEFNPSKGLLVNPTVHGKKSFLKDHQHDLLHYAFGSSDESESDVKKTVIALWPTGTGKTIGSAACIARAYLQCEDPKSFRALFVATPSYKEKAYKELCTWLSLEQGKEIVMINERDEFEDERKWKSANVIVTSLATMQALEQTFWYKNTHEEKIAGTKRRKTASAPTEWIKTNDDPEFYKLIEKYPLDMMIVDEVHKFHNTMSYMHRYLHRLCRCSKKVLALTATIVKNRPEELPGICSALDVRPEDLQTKQRWILPGSGCTKLRKQGIKLLHRTCIHQVKEDDNKVIGVQMQKIDWEITPYVGMCSDGTTDTQFVAELNEQLNHAKSCARKTSQRAGEVLQTNQVLWKTVYSGTQAPISKVISRNNADELEAKAEELFKKASEEKSATLILLHKLIRSRQMAGKERVVVFMDSQKGVRHVCNVLHELGQCGRIVPFDGKVSQRYRNKAVEDFLSPRNPRGVFIITRTGEESITLCGPAGRTCSVLIQLGCDWSPESDTQLYGRIHRIVQSEDVEIINMYAKNGMMAAKRSCHFDKSSRLVPAMKNEDFRGFRTDDADEEYRKNKSIITAMTELDQDGNYLPNPLLMDATDDWEDEVRECQKANKPPPLPLNVKRYRVDIPTRPEDTPIPPVSFPRANFDPNRSKGRHFDEIKIYGSSGEKYHKHVMQQTNTTPHLFNISKRSKKRPLSVVDLTGE